MFLEPTEGKLPGQKIKFKYDCNGGNKRCSGEFETLYRVAKKNFDDHGSKHICRTCQLQANNPMYSDENKEKIKKTNLKKYGVSCALNTEENMKTRVKKMFGTEEAIEKITKKRQKTTMERYGVSHVMKDAEIRQRSKDTTMQNYGVDVPLKNPEIVAKMQETNLERYGVKNVAQTQEVQDKMKKTNLELYGVENYFQTPEIIEYVKKHNKEWLQPVYDSGGYRKGKPIPEDQKERQRQTVARKMLAGEWNGGYTSNLRGTYPSVKCRKENPRFMSSLELIFHFYLDHHVMVEYYDYMPFYIPYVKADDSTHYYFPDFLVKYANTDIIYIYEIKGTAFKNDKDVKLKEEAAIEYLKLINMKYEMLYDNDIKRLKLNLEDIKKTEGIVFQKSE